MPQMAATYVLCKYQLSMLVHVYTYDKFIVVLLVYGFYSCPLSAEFSFFFNFADYNKSSREEECF